MCASRLFALARPGGAPLPMRKGTRMVLLPAAPVARLAPEIADEAAERRVDADFTREVGGDLDVLRQQGERKASGEFATEHMLRDQALAREAAASRGIDDVGHDGGGEDQIAVDNDSLD